MSYRPPQHQLVSKQDTANKTNNEMVSAVNRNDNDEAQNPQRSINMHTRPHMTDKIKKFALRAKNKDLDK